LHRFSLRPNSRQCSQSCVDRNYITSEFYNNCVVNYISSNTTIAKHLHQRHYYKLVYLPPLLQILALNKKTTKSVAWNIRCEYWRRRVRPTLHT